MAETGLMNRRRLVRNSLASLPFVYSPLRFLSQTLADGRNRPITKPLISATREVRTVVGLRPYREKGFRVEREHIGSKTVVHNYGHGGAGLTLSWGTAKLALDLGLQGHRGSVAVLGCGAVGLATARSLQDLGYAVTIYTALLPRDTTSNLAGGQWGPSSPFGNPSGLTETFRQQYVQSCSIAYSRFQSMLGSRFGVRWVRNYLILQNPLPASMPLPTDGPPTFQNPTAGMMPEFKILAAADNPFGVGNAIQYDFMLIEPPIYLATLLSAFREAGGKVEVKEFHTVQELRQLPQRLVFNCTGLGAGKLFRDAGIQPLRGQLSILLPQPEVDFATAYRDSYMFPRNDGILIGGTHDLGEWSLTPDSKSRDERFQQQNEIYAKLKSS